MTLFSLDFVLLRAVELGTGPCVCLERNRIGNQLKDAATSGCTLSPHADFGQRYPIFELYFGAIEYKSYWNVGWVAEQSLSFGAGLV